MSDEARIPSDRQRQWLRLARAAAGRALGLDPPPVSVEPSDDDECGGVFVTFWRGKTLRGCVGTFTSGGDLRSLIEDMTRASLRDTRFAAHPITRDELPALNIEISVLGKPRRADDPLALVPGKDGVIVRREGRSGCFLPKVAADRGWTAEETLKQCCAMKAGLPADAWRRPDTEVLLFRAQVFSEADGEDG